MNIVQNKILDIYIEIKKICDKNDIRFFAIGGTAIGAERHKGFIPWDDDLDIAIPNNDYSKFLSCCQNELPPHLKMFDYHSSKHCLICWNKIHDERTAFLEKNTIEFDDYHYGIFVDIMPMYGVPVDFNKYNKKIKKYRILNSLKQNSITQMKSIKRILAKIALFPINAFLPRKFWLKKLDTYQANWSFDQSNYVGYTWHTLTDRLVFERSWFDSYIELPFETTTMRCCKSNKEMLERQFSDYLSLPPENERVSNHYVKVIDVNHSYKDYNTRGELINE